ncbi:MAG TPA: hypothetical protein VGL95_10750 [Acetobacteraceae bacterium]|jgi:hypothetical protein
MTDAPPPQHQADPTQQLSDQAYRHLIHTLFALLPPPPADTPEALQTRDDAAIAKIAALAPVNADEADIAAHCVAARAQAGDVLRLIRVHSDDTHLVMKLNVQYALLERTSGSIRAQLQRLQAARQKREPSSDPATADELARYIAARQMQQVLDQDFASAVPAAVVLVPALSGEPPPAPAPMPAVLAPALPPPTPAPVVAPPLSRRARTVLETGEPPRDLAAEADYYAIVYPNRARPIRRCGGLPPDYDFGPPDEDLVRAIVTSPVLHALDGPATGAA